MTIKIKDELRSISIELARLVHDCNHMRGKLQCLDARLADQNYRLGNQLEAIIKEMKNEAPRSTKD